MTPSPHNASKIVPSVAAVAAVNQETIMNSLNSDGPGALALEPLCQAATHELLVRSYTIRTVNRYKRVWEQLADFARAQGLPAEYSRDLTSEGPLQSETCRIPNECNSAVAVIERPCSGRLLCGDFCLSFVHTHWRLFWDMQSFTEDGGARDRVRRTAPQVIACHVVRAIR